MKETSNMRSLFAGVAAAKGLFIAALCVLCFPAPGGAQEAPTQSANDETMDEITVVAPRSLVAIERQIERADFALYNISNTLIDDPMYKVYCLRETSAGTKIKKRVCKAGFERELMSEAWEDEQLMSRQGENNYSFNYKKSNDELREHREAFKQKLIELAAESPELAQAIYRRANLQRDYALEKQRRQQKED